MAPRHWMIIRRVPTPARAISLAGIEDAVLARLTRLIDRKMRRAVSRPCGPQALLLLIVLSGFRWPYVFRAQFGLVIEPSFGHAGIQANVTLVANPSPSCFFCAEHDCTQLRRVAIAERDVVQMS